MFGIGNVIAKAKAKFRGVQHNQKLAAGIKEEEKVTKLEKEAAYQEVMLKRIKRQEAARGTIAESKRARFQQSKIGRLGSGIAKTIEKTREHTAKVKASGGGMDFGSSGKGLDIGGNGSFDFTKKKEEKPKAEKKRSITINI